MNSNRLIEELLSEQTRVIDELDRLNTRIEDVLKSLALATKEELPTDPASCEPVAAPPESMGQRRRAA